MNFINMALNSRVAIEIVKSENSRACERCALSRYLLKTLEKKLSRARLIRNKCNK